MNRLYPVFINLENKSCVVVGGGLVAFRKVTSLLEAKARITIISPQLCDVLSSLIDRSEINFLKREFRSGDLANAFLVIAATDDAKINQLVWEEANERDILVNVVDVPSLCNFYVPSVMRDYDLAIAISTNGKAPYLSKKLRLKLESYFKRLKIGKLITQIDTEKQKLKKLYPDDIKKREEQIKQFIDELIEL